jgi:hypothetical protein
VIVLFTIRATKRKARESNPHSPKRNRVSSAARPTVSGYLPLMSMLDGVDHRGVEPRFPGCKPGVVPLDQQPSFKESSRRESNPRFLFVREVSLPLDHGTVNFVPRRVARVGVEPTDIRLSA